MRFNRIQRQAYALSRPLGPNGEVPEGRPLGLYFHGIERHGTALTVEGREGVTYWFAAVSWFGASGLCIPVARSTWTKPALLMARRIAIAMLAGVGDRSGDEWKEDSRSIRLRRPLTAKEIEQMREVA